MPVEGATGFFKSVGSRCLGEAATRGIRAFLLILWPGTHLRTPFSSQENGPNGFGFGFGLHPQEKCSAEGVSLIRCGRAHGATADRSGLPLPFAASCLPSVVSKP